ncbi:trypsin-like peptidase domain-containing protein [Streptomyces sp. NPDC127091]|uniref:trypsin-like peptidase domain-containing protein n=1 Tax=Streptomyces sp. NPDC127091 TaxID=3347134 RepID=UPI003663CE6B
MRGVHSIHTLSFGALYIEAWHRSLGEAEDTRLGPATGFLIGVPGDFWLVTAWHVLSGRRSDNGDAIRKDGLRPDYLRVRFAGEGQGGYHPVDQHFELYDGEFQSSPRWRSHSERRIDIAALYIGAVPEAAVEAFMPNTWPTLRDLFTRERRAQVGSEMDVDIPLRITDRLFVLGFPFGNTGSWPFAVWTAAPVASEPLARWDQLPGFVLDSRTRPGQSGSPVVMHIRPGEPVVAGGDVIVHEESVTALVGVYSGRLDPNADLGMVWTTDALFEILPEVAPPGWTPPDPIL